MSNPNELQDNRNSKFSESSPFNQKLENILKQFRALLEDLELLKRWTC
ncbi:MAG: hypothetical protein V3V14_09870 [Saprospiraceae bacterium]